MIGVDPKSNEEKNLYYKTGISPMMSALECLMPQYFHFSASRESIVTEDTSKAEIVSRPPSPEPGSMEWSYVDQPLDTVCL